MAEASRWYVLTKQEEEPKGPYSIDQLRARLTEGGITSSAMVNEAGSTDWVPIGSVVDTGATSAAKAKPPSSDPTQTSSKGLTVAMVVLLAIIVLEFAGATYVVITTVDKHEAARSAALEEARSADNKRRQAERAEAKGKLVDLKHVKSDCFADNSYASCHVTNFTDETIIACMQGVVMQKESAGVRLYSMPVCTGPVRALETRQVTSPWAEGRPRDLCTNGRYLDWEMCNFTVINYDPAQK